MISGYVLAFRPSTQEGTIITEQGQTVRFSTKPNSTDLHGGDIVAWAADSGDQRAGLVDAGDIQVLEKGSDWLASRHRPLLRDLYATLEIGHPLI